MNISSMSPIKKYILRNVRFHSKDIAAAAIKRFGISRPAVMKHINGLIKDNLLRVKGKTKDRTYSLEPLFRKRLNFDLTPNLEETIVWIEEVKPLLLDLKANVYWICEHGFTEILNNAIDHSEGEKVLIEIWYNPVSIKITIFDDGIGIFNNIRIKRNLSDNLQAAIELAKGKLTTDPQSHSGEGIFFTSRMFDYFSILSGTLYFDHVRKNNDWVLEQDTNSVNGTSISMELDLESNIRGEKIFEEYASEDNDYKFSKTIFPVKLVKIGDENLISRSQAKRILSRFDQFKEIILDFSDIDNVGYAFVDELFRVFPLKYPNISITTANTTKKVQLLIDRAKSSRID